MSGDEPEVAVGDLHRDGEVGQGVGVWAAAKPPRCTDDQF